MPYINQERRDALLPALTELNRNIETPGDLNYAFTVLAQSFAPLDPASYTSLNEIVGVFECAKAEFLRTVVAPFEDVKRKDHGDIERL